MISNQNMRNQIIGQKFNEQYPKLLEQKEFTRTLDLSNEWWRAKDMALRHASPVMLGISPTQFEDLYYSENDNKITMLQFAIMNTQIEKTTPYQMSALSFADYIELMKECIDMASWWNAECKSMRDELEKKLNAEQDEIEKGLAFNYTQKAEA